MYEIAIMRNDDDGINDLLELLSQLIGETEGFRDLDRGDELVVDELIGRQPDESDLHAVDLLDDEGEDAFTKFVRASILTRIKVGPEHRKFRIGRIDGIEHRVRTIEPVMVADDGDVVADLVHHFENFASRTLGVVDVSLGPIAPVDQKRVRDGFALAIDGGLQAGDAPQIQSALIGSKMGVKIIGMKNGNRDGSRGCPSGCNRRAIGAERE